MKAIFFSAILLTIGCFETQAQSCEGICPYYNSFMSMAQADTVKNTQTKLNYYRAAIVAARDCNCPKLEQNAYEQIDTLFILIEAEKRKIELQSQTILEQQKNIRTALINAEAANKKNLKIVNAMDFYDGKFALASKDKKYGFIDKKGNTKINFDYNSGGPFDSETGFAEMEIEPSYRLHIKYLIDTIGNRYQLFDISEESIIRLNRRLINRIKDKKTQSNLEDIEPIIELVSEELVKGFKPKYSSNIALSFQDVEKDNALEMLEFLAKSTIKDKVEVLILEEENIDVFSESITGFKNLKYIDAYWTDIKTIPESVDRLKNLKKLRLPSQVKEVPSSIYNLEKLETLDLSETELDTLPEMVENLKSLKELRLPGSLVSFPESIVKLKTLESLDLFFTELKVVPEFIGELKSLKRLELPFSLPKAPSSIYNLENLEYLYLSGTNQMELSKDIGNLKKLKDLTIKMPLENCPLSLSNLENLEVLNLYQTRLTNLPEGISKLQKIKTLNLPRTLVALPENIGNLRNLEELNLLGTRILKIPKSLGNLISLEKLFLPLSKENLPESIGNLENLEFLYLSTSLESLSEEIGNLRSLKDLTISNSQNFKKIPDISQLKKLEHFYLTLYEGENYTVNLEELEVLQEKLPNCVFHIKNEKGEEINIKKK